MSPDKNVALYHLFWPKYNLKIESSNLKTMRLWTFHDLPVQVLAQCPLVLISISIKLSNATIGSQFLYFKQNRGQSGWGRIMEALFVLPMLAELDLPIEQQGWVWRPHGGLPFQVTETLPFPVAACSALSLEKYIQTLYGSRPALSVSARCCVFIVDE